MPPEKISGQAFEENERLIIVSSRDKLLEEGDLLPRIVGARFDSDEKASQFYDVNAIQGIKILSIVNMHDTEICDLQTARMEAFAKSHPDVTVISVSKQEPEDLGRVAETQSVSHMLLSIDDETAEILGVQLEPEESASPEWRLMLLRGIIVADSNNRIVHFQRVYNQMDEPDYEAAFNTVEKITI